jgi:hypothetical protein
MKERLVIVVENPVLAQVLREVLRVFAPPYTMSHRPGITAEGQAMTSDFETARAELRRALRACSPQVRSLVVDALRHFAPPPPSLIIFPS